MIFEPSARRRTRPSLISLAFSGVVAVFALYLILISGAASLGYLTPLVVGSTVGAGVALYRTLNLRKALPPPYGAGRITRIDSRRTARDGILLTLGLLGVMVLLFASTLFVSPVVLFFPVVLGLCFGLPLSQVLYFGVVESVERRSKSRVYTLSEDSSENEEPVILKSVVLRSKERK